MQRRILVWPAGLRAGAVKKWITNHDAKTNRPSRNGQFATVRNTGAVADFTSSDHYTPDDNQGTLITYQPCIEDDNSF